MKLTRLLTRLCTAAVAALVVAAAATALGKTALLWLGQGSGIRAVPMSEGQTVDF